MEQSNNNKLNIRDKVITINQIVSLNLQFNISKGQLRWVKNDQVIEINEFEVVPALKFKKIEVLSDYENQDILDKFNTAIGKVHDKFKKYMVLDNVEPQDEEDKQQSQTEQQEQKPKQPDDEINYTSDDIYNGRQPNDLANIWQHQGEVEISIIVNQLKLSKDIMFENDPLVFEFSPQKITETIISHTEAKKAKILVNNSELRPKEEIGFLKEMIPYIKFSIFLDK